MAVVSKSETREGHEVGADTVVGIVRGTGSLQGGAAAAVHVFTVKGGKITRFREFVDLDRAIGS